MVHKGIEHKNLTSLDPRIAKQLNGILNEASPLKDCMTFGATMLCQKETAKSSAVDNYSSIFD